MTIMLNDNSITENTKIRNFLIMLGLTLFLTKPQIAHVCSLIAASTQRGFRGKLIDIEDLLIESKHRTSIGKFLCSTAWNESFVLKKLQQFVIGLIWGLSTATGMPIYIIIDDTISEKTKPSSKAKKPTQKAKFHQSHLKNKTVYGHQIVIVLLQCGRIKLPLLISLYDKQKQSKIQMALDIISMLPPPANKVYVLADSWYSSKKVIKASRKAGFNYIGGMKVNRIIYPEGYRMNRQIQGFAKELKIEDFHLVTVRKSQYYVYRYQGKINGVSGDVVVIISWPKDAFGIEKALKAFVCTDLELSTEEILKHYCCRWPIEVFIRQTKMVLGLNKYQVRKEVAFKRYWLMVMLSYVYIASQAAEKNYSFSSGLKTARRNVFSDMLLWVYKQGENRIPFDVVISKVFKKPA
jgi:Transposase DDE domain